MQHGLAIVYSGCYLELAGTMLPSGRVWSSKLGSSRSSKPGLSGGSEPGSSRRSEPGLSRGLKEVQVGVRNQDEEVVRNQSEVGFQYHDWNQDRVRGQKEVQSRGSEPRSNRQGVERKVRRVEKQRKEIASKEGKKGN